MNVKAGTLSAALRERTSTLHRQAERTGFVGALLKGRGTLDGYASLLRGLLPVYEAMENALATHTKSNGVGLLALPAVYRTEAIRADLEEISAATEFEPPALSAAEHYAERVRMAGAGDGARLIAHAYTRYLGDLNGGRVLRTQLAKTLSLDPSALSFFDFPDIDDVRAFVASYRARIDQAGESLHNRDEILEESAQAFRCNIALSEAVETQVAARCESGSEAVNA